MSKLHKAIPVADVDAGIGYFIRCNGADVHVNADTLALDGAWGGEQCEGCGADIADTGALVGPKATALALCRVVCRECDAVYRVEHTGGAR